MAVVRRPGQLAQVLAQIDAEVGSLPGPAMRALAPVLHQAEQELARDLARWLRMVPNGEARFTAQQLRVALVQIRGAMRTMRGLNPALFEVLEQVNGRAGPMAMGHLARQVERFSMLFEGSIRPLPIAPAAVLARGDRLLIRRFRESAARYGEWAATEISKQLAVGVVRGETFAELTKRLQGLSPTARAAAGMVRGAGETAEDIARALGQRIKNRAELIVRTEAINAYNAHAYDGLVAAASEDPGYRMRWDAANDRRLCPLCRALDGVVVKIDAVFPGGVKHPPLHPRCRCALTPWHEEWTVPSRAVSVPPPKVEPAPAAPHPGRTANASKVVDLASKYTPHAPMPAASQTELREALRTVVEAEGIRTLPTAAGGRSRNNVLVIKPMRELAGARGVMDIINGEMSIAAEVMEGAARGVANDLRTLVHETVHWYSAIEPGVYRGLGRLVEEVTTEVSARAIMRTQFGVTVPAISYQEWIDATVVRIMRIGNMSSEKAYKALERASLQLRRSPPARAFREGREYAEAWAARVFPGEVAKQHALVSELAAVVP